MVSWVIGCTVKLKFMLVVAARVSKSSEKLNTNCKICDIINIDNKYKYGCEVIIWIKL
jgi:hypothetical protein